MPNFRSTTARFHYALLTTHNFWEKQEWEKDDFHLKALSCMPFYRDFPFIPEKTGLFGIRGPRQDGKSSEYIAFLEDCFAVQTLYVIDPVTGAFRFRKEEKFYFRDPFIYWLGQDFIGNKSSPRSF